MKITYTSILSAICSSILLLGFLSVYIWKKQENYSLYEVKLLIFCTVLTGVRLFFPIDICGISHTIGIKILYPELCRFMRGKIGFLSHFSVLFLISLLGSFLILVQKSLSYISFIKLIKEKKISDFSGFIFEENFNINEVIDYSYKELNFTETTFIKEVLFNNYIFKGKTIFNQTNFLDFTTFINSKFRYTAIFNNVIFNSKHSNKKIFMGVEFTGQNLVISSVYNLPRLDGIKFDDYTKFILLDVDYEKEHYINGKINYRIARNQANKIGDHERIGYYYYKERAYGSKNIRVEDYPTYRDYLSTKFFDALSKYTVGYGERPWNILIVSVMTISIFALLYMFIGIKTLNNELIGISIKTLSQHSLVEILNTYIDLWYFSMVTFTTVGYGDMIVTTTIGKILVGLEVFFGITIGAAWTSVIIKRMIR